jgi:LSD1 subclass zinc finger protein
MLVVKANCSHCGAPLGLEQGQRYVVCAYCDTSLKVEPVAASGPASGAAPRLTAQPISEGTVKRVKELVLGGRRDEAVALYAEAAGLSRREAEEAVTQLVQLDLLKLLRQAPVSSVGLLVALVPMALAAWGLERSLTWALGGESGYFALAAFCALVIVTRILWLVPKAISAYVLRFGREGRARIVKRAVVQSGMARNGSLVLVLFEVTPLDGGRPFHDEEPMLVRAESLEKLAPGNVIRVRYSEPGRERVFPTIPIEVMERGGG